MRAPVLAITLFFSLPLGALAADSIDVMTEQQPADVVVVKQCTGLRSQMKEITTKLETAKHQQLLTSVEFNEFARRATEIADEMGEPGKKTLSLQQQLAISKDLSVLTDDINRGLRRTQQLVAYYSPDGEAPITAQQLSDGYSQLQRDIKDAVAHHNLTPEDAAKYRRELQTLMRTAFNQNDHQQLAYVGKRMRKLSLHVQAVAHAGTLSENPASASYLTLPRAF